MNAGVRGCMRVGMRLPPRPGPCTAVLGLILLVRTLLRGVCQPGFMPAPRFGVTDQPGDRRCVRLRTGERSDRSRSKKVYRGGGSQLRQEVARWNVGTLSWRS